MPTSARAIPDLQLALFKRGVDELMAGRERCCRCHRTPLIGERVYVYESGALACELCRIRERGTPLGSRLVHGPEFGHTIKINEQRAAA